MMQHFDILQLTSIATEYHQTPNTSLSSHDQWVLDSLSKYGDGETLIHLIEWHVESMKRSDNLQPLDNIKLKRVEYVADFIKAHRLYTKYIYPVGYSSQAQVPNLM